MSEEIAHLAALDNMTNEEVAGDISVVAFVYNTKAPSILTIRTVIQEKQLGLDWQVLMSRQQIKKGIDLLKSF